MAYFGAFEVDTYFYFIEVFELNLLANGLSVWITSYKEVSGSLIYFTPIRLSLTKDIDLRTF
jgi:hypothetical protein